MAEMMIKKWVGEKGEIEEDKRPKVIDEMNDPFARQKLITWWDQEKIENATIGVLVSEQLATNSFTTRRYSVSRKWCSLIWTTLNFPT